MQHYGAINYTSSPRRRNSYVNGKNWSTKLAAPNPSCLNRFIYCFVTTSLLLLLVAFAWSSIYMLWGMSLPSWKTHAGYRDGHRVTLRLSETRQIFPQSQWDDTSMSLRISSLNYQSSAHLGVNVYTFPPSSSNETLCPATLDGPLIINQDKKAMEIRGYTYQYDSFHLNSGSTIHMNISMLTPASGRMAGSGERAQPFHVYLYQGIEFLEWFRTAGALGSINRGKGNTNTSVKNDSSESNANDEECHNDEDLGCVATQEFFHGYLRKLDVAVADSASPEDNTSLQGDISYTVPDSNYYVIVYDNDYHRPIVASSNDDYTYNQVVNIDGFSKRINEERADPTSTAAVEILVEYNIIETTHDLSRFTPDCTLGKIGSSDDCSCKFATKGGKNANETKKTDMNKSCIIVQAISLHPDGDPVKTNEEDGKESEHGDDDQAMTVEWNSSRCWWKFWLVTFGPLAATVALLKVFCNQKEHWFGTVSLVGRDAGGRHTHSSTSRRSTTTPDPNSSSRSNKNKLIEARLVKEIDDGICSNEETPIMVVDATVLP